MIEHQVSDGIATITLNRPPVNAWDDDQLSRFQDILREVEKTDISVILVRSALRLFSAGADLGVMHGKFQSTEGQAEMRDFVRHIQETYALLESSSKVTIVEIAGAALGGGLELALACDLRIAAHEARLGLPEAGIGLLPGAGGTQRLTRMVGEGMAKRLILGAESITGEEALSMGLVQWSVPRAEIADFALETARRIAALPAHSVALSKSCIDAGRDPAIDGYQAEVDGSAQLFAHPATHARVKGFLDGQR